MTELNERVPANLLLLDGNSILNRAYFAMARGKQLTAPDGRPTAAAFSFFNMLFSYLDKLKPERTVVCFDRPEPTFRKEAYAGYKAGRREMEDDLAQQFPLVKEGLTLMGIDRVEVPGYEADDLVATLCREAEEKGQDKIFVLSGDRDLWQLISERVTLIYPYNRKGKRGRELMTPEVFSQEYGFAPEHLLDYKALKGDASDNIPGVKGIGEKTATQLIQAYSTLDAVYDHLEEIKPRQAHLLENGREEAELSYRLAKLHYEVPYSAGYLAGELDPEGLAAYFEKLGFRSFQERFELNKSAGTPCEITTDWEEFPIEKIIEEGLQEELYIYIQETVVGLAVSSKQYALLAPEVFADIWHGRLREDAEAKFVFWAGKDQLRKLKLLPPKSDYYDVEVAAYLLNLLDSAGSHEDNLSLVFKELCGRELQFADGAEGLRETGPSGASAQQAVLTALAALVALREKTEEALAREDLGDLAHNLEFPLARILAQMEAAGIAIDQADLQQLSESMRKEIDDLEKQIYFYLGREINLNSSKQLGTVLFEELKLPGAKKTKSGAYSTAASVLEALRYAHPVIPLILEYRELTKLLSTFVDGLAKEIAADGRVHTIFKQTLTSTGRLSSAEPNLQNIPIKSTRAKEIRDLFVAGEGRTFIDADYSQIELRLLAVLSEDQNLLKAFREGEDIHTSTATLLFNKPAEEITPRERRDAKTVNFSVIYGISDFGLSQNLEITVAEAKKMIEAYDAHYPRVRPWMEEQAALAKERGYVKTVLGRRRYIPELKSKNYHQRKFGERAAMNAPVQGSAADLIKLAMLRVDEALATEGLDALLLLQVHDELLIECSEQDAPKVARILREAMEGALDLGLPLKVELSQGKSWGSMQVNPA